MIHSDLLDIAEHLATFDAGRPRRTSLRRAVSSAYYALFHALAAVCADTLIGWNKSWEVLTPIYRSLDHGRSKDAFVKIGARHGAEIEKIGLTFIELQKLRHDADYDPRPFAPSRAETLDTINQAREALELIDKLTQQQRLLLASHLIARTR